MKILIDADSCPVKEIIVEVAKAYNLEVIMFFDTSHVYNDNYSQVITVDQGKDNVDFELVKYIEQHDIIVTQDYGLASMVLIKKVSVLNQNGLIYTKDNIDALLLQRFLAQKERKVTKRNKGPKKRTLSQDIQFKKSFLSLINKNALIT